MAPDFEFGQATPFSKRQVNTILKDVESYLEKAYGGQPYEWHEMCLYAKSIINSHLDVSANPSHNECELIGRVALAMTIIHFDVKVDCVFSVPTSSPTPTSAQETSDG